MPATRSPAAACPWNCLPRTRAQLAGIPLSPSCAGCAYISRRQSGIAACRILGDAVFLSMPVETARCSFVAAEGGSGNGGSCDGVCSFMLHRREQRPFRCAAQPGGSTQTTKLLHRGGVDMVSLVGQCCCTQAAGRTAGKKSWKWTPRSPPPGGGSEHAAKRRPAHTQRRRRYAGSRGGTTREHTGDRWECLCDKMSGRRDGRTRSRWQVGVKRREHHR